MIAEAARHVGVLRDYWDTLTDPAHLLTELTIEAFSAIPAWIYARVWVKRHDRRQHGEKVISETLES